MDNLIARLLMILRAFLAGIAAAMLLSQPAAAAVDCEGLAEAAAREKGIPTALLPSIARIESGKKQGELGVRAWPWTLNQQGKGMYFENREDALAHLKKAVASGVTNIDVGCMQINYRWHGDQFSSLEEMMDPVANTRYAATFLSNLYKRHKNWEIATRYYHSPKEERGKWYQGKVASVMRRILEQGDVRVADVSAAEMTTATSIQVIAASQPTPAAPPIRPSVPQPQPQPASQVVSRGVLTSSPGGALIAIRPSAQRAVYSQSAYENLIPSSGPLEVSFLMPDYSSPHSVRSASLRSRWADVEAFRDQFKN